MGKIIFNKQDAYVKEFYELIKQSFEGNLSNYKVKVIIDDGVNPVHIEYITPSDSEVEFSKRKGRLEIKTE